MRPCNGVLTLVLAVMISMTGQCRGTADVRLAKTNYEVLEGETFSIELIITGVATSTILVAVRITNANAHGGNDFEITNALAPIGPGNGRRNTNVYFTVHDDDDAENAEVFTFEVIIVGDGDGRRAPEYTGTITIAASDDAFGEFSFINGMANPVVVREPPPDAPYHLRLANFTIVREGGMFGEVILNVVFEEPPVDSATPGTDVNITTRQVVFADMETSAELQIEVLPDDIPEGDESLYVTLEMAAGGISRDPTAKEAMIKNGQAMLQIPANDDPIRFHQATYYNPIEDRYELEIQVDRGHWGVPPLGQASVSYGFVPFTAENSKDFSGENGTLVFDQGQYNLTIDVTILPDDQPEKEEKFYVVLYDAVGDVVLTDPSTVAVIIKENDSPQGVFVILQDQDFYIDEDNPDQSTDIVIYRDKGTFGEVKVRWQLVSMNGGAVTGVKEVTGEVVFEEGQTQAVVELEAPQDQERGPAKTFRFHLTAATDGAVIGNPASAKVMLKDSDDIYGVVNIDDVDLLRMTPPVLRIALERTADSLETVRVAYIVKYIYGDLEKSDIFTSDMPAEITLEPRIRTTLLYVAVKENTFLEYGARFQIQLINVTLVSGVVGFNSPRIGQTDIMAVDISADAANGVIGFENTTMRRVSEPEGNQKTTEVTLRLKRSGTKGVADIYWEVQSSDPSSGPIDGDLSPTSGTVRMMPGDASAEITFDILPDDIPETDEMFTISLRSEQSGISQRIDQAARQVDITVSENDSPGGIFEFATTMTDNYVVEEGEGIEISVVRLGGNLANRTVLFYIEGNRMDQFYGSKNIMHFYSGETEMNATIAAIDDDEAELEAHFTLILEGYGPNPGQIGDRRFIYITIKENDFPYGVIHFDASLHNQTIQESKGDVIRTVSLTVMRSQGLFRSVTVSWSVAVNETAPDLSPQSGVLTFSEREATAVIMLQSWDDQIPEGDETFEVILTNATNGASIGTPSTAFITIAANDNPIYFKEPVIRIREPSSPTLTVVRQGPLDTEVTVMYRTEDGLATARDADYIPMAGNITFGRQQNESSLTLEVVDDTLPEPDEIFYVRLFNPKGDVSVYGSDRATIIISASDDASGIFHFTEPYRLSTSEGEPAEFRVRREKGVFGEVQVHWIALNATTGMPVNNTDFQPSTGNVTFDDRQQEAALLITPAMDNLPEYSEFFIIRLTHISGPGEVVGSVAPTNIEVLLEVIQNDDPSGVFTFPQESRNIAVAEDANPGEEDKARAEVTIYRRQGTVGEVMVAWEVFSYPVGGLDVLPAPTDLLFYGTFPPNVTEAQDKRRPGTGSMALYFSGCPVCYVEVPAEYQVAADTIVDGFTISTWIQPLTDTSGFILAKTSPTTLQHHYALMITTSSVGAILEFFYTVAATENTQSVNTQVIKNLEDGEWHHILVTVASGFTDFYVDGERVGSRRLLAESTTDGLGVLVAGARWPGADFFTGYMQDVRIFNRKLDASEMEELFKTPAKADLRPISGYVTFPAGVSHQNITIYSVDDNEEEPSEEFAVRLIAARGGARLSRTEAVAVLTVMKNDNANGLFGLRGRCTMDMPPQWQYEGVVWECTVDRTRGDADTVTVTWELRGRNPPGPPVSDFVNTTGEVIFQPGQRENVLRFQEIDDDQPEVEEVFLVLLTGAQSSDGEAGSTATSGASIDPTAFSTQIRTQANDYPNGLLRFSDGPVPGPNDLLEPATQRPQIPVREEDGMVHLLVVRARGLVGQVMVEWRTLAETARGSGKTPPDYVERKDSLVFNPGQNYAFINVTIIDNQIPEDVKTFDVELVNATGGAAVGLGSRVTVEIQPSDSAFGQFYFHRDSRNVSVTENGTGEIRLRVLRSGGTITRVTVYWAVVSDNGNDVNTTSGQLEFGQSQAMADIVIRLNDDNFPELDEVFIVQLLNSTSGNLGTQDKSHVTILANDDPYGVFVISSANRPIRTVETNTEVTMRVERASSDMFGAVNVTWRTVLPTEPAPILAPAQTRAGLSDYRQASGWLMFDMGQNVKSFNITILDDSEPETNEVVYVVLDGVELVSAGQSRPVVGSPRLGPGDQSYGQIIIEENDGSAGVIQLSASQVTVQEGFSGDIVFVERLQGAFKEVTVNFRVLSGTAESDDYSFLSTNVLLLSGERRKAIRAQIVDDLHPELAETFTIELESVIGGATLGAVRQTTTVQINESDDPHGVFLFQDRRLAVEEPPDGSTAIVNLPVVRRRGTLDVVTVSWQATLGGEIATNDVQPSSGTLYFLTSDVRLNITITILPDVEPEGLENVIVTLTNANNGGRLEPEQSQFTLAILPNDNPHGTIEFDSANFVVYEAELDTPQNISVTRVGGSYGPVRVYYKTADVDLMTEALKDGQTVFDYFKDPASGKVELANTGTRLPVGNLQDPLQACAQFCLMTEACMSFDFNAQLSECTWYPVGDLSFVVNRPGYVYYESHAQKKSALFDRRASPGLDYGPITDGSVIMEEGVRVGSIPVVVRADNVPELEEIFEVMLTRVELLGGPPPSPTMPPRLGARRSRTVTIDKNDNANGVFRIFSSDPRAMTTGRVMLIEEREKYSVELIVQRQGGTIGEVSVTWKINVTSTNATRGQDFIADGATLTFGPGDTQRTLTIGIEDDTMPEDDEWIVVELSEPTGGATVSSESSVRVVVTANDNVGGVLYFTQTSYLVQEGGVFKVTVERTDGSLGEVTVIWVLEAVNSEPPELKFNMYTGIFTFGVGEYQKDVTLMVLEDSQPKINQEYSLKLVNITTQGVRQTGAAGVDPQKSVAIVTIEGGNEPHGVFSFADGSQRLEVAESAQQAQLIIDRKFGSIGDVRVNYEIKRGNIQSLTPDLVAAEPGSDFRSEQGSITILNQVNSGQIDVDLYDDDRPEVDEVFLVDILSLELLRPRNSNFQPRLATQGTTAEVIIMANDGTHGRVVFSENSRQLQVDEATVNITLTILRQLGTFGEVSVFCFAQSMASGATLGADYSFEPREIQFAAGQAVTYVVVSMYDDEDPEPREELQIILASPKGGLTIGAEHRAVITIMASDQASGVVSFESSEAVTLNEPTPLNSAQSQAELRLTRAPGVFGIVNVPFRVRSVTGGGDNVTDLTPVEGFVTFRDREGTVTLEISAVADDIPEEAETFLVTLLAPDTASLGLVIERTLVIERNDAPYGRMEIYPAGSRNRSVTVEEGRRVVYVDILRSLGSLEEVSVDVVTRAITAYSQMGADLRLATIQQLNVRIMKGWGSVEVGGATYLVMVNHQRVAPLRTAVGSSGEGRDINLNNITQSALFRWQGAAVPVQSIETDGASGVTSFNIEGTAYLFMTNYGGPSRHETLSRLYKVNPEGGLEVVQDIPTKGATDAVQFTQNNDHYLVVTNYIDNNGQTSVTSEVYQWDFSQVKFTSAPVQRLATRGATAAAVVRVDSELFLVIANSYDAGIQKYELNSLVYKLDDNNRFTIHQQIATKGAVDVDTFLIGSDAYIVLANGLDDTGRYHQMAELYVWNRGTQLFSWVQEIPASEVQTVRAFTTPDGKVHLSIAMLKSSSVVYSWDDSVGEFRKTWDGRPLQDLYPVTVDQRAGPLTLMVEARPYNVSGMSTVDIYQLATVNVGDSDYIHRAITLTFGRGQTFLRTSVVVLEDDVPEDTESFAVELTNPRGGAELGQNKEVVIRILSNDDGHGVIEFAEDSVERYEEEVPGRDHIIQLNVVRNRGSSGRVVISWKAEGVHNGRFDLTPNEGQVEFAEGQTVATVTLTIKDDSLPENDEVSLISLAEVIEPGTNVPGRGAKIGQRSASRVTVMANDSPYGTVAWNKTSYVVREGSGTSVTLHVTRTQGSVGRIRVGYISSIASRLPPENQAVSGLDYRPVQGTVDLDSGVTSASVNVVILEDEIPEVDETFLVNLTDVQVIGGATVVGVGASIRRPGQVASVVIGSNDSPGGVIEFGVVKNNLGRVDTFEGSPPLRLAVVRSQGLFGEVVVAWETTPREATSDDYRPPAGTVTFGEGEREAFIEVDIVDDDLPEAIQTFEVKLARVASGDATLGSENMVLVGILQNDSPSGIFSFVPTQKSVRESVTSDDPRGRVVFDVQRRGTEGVVNVRWRLSAAAVDDFQLPLQGTLTFGPAEQYKRITLRTLPDTVVEGEERYTLSLVSADRGDISPTAGDATVVILADPGASGIISIAAESRFVMLGEPSISYDGRAQIEVRRAMGTFGLVQVEWQIVPRDPEAFVQNRGVVSFTDQLDTTLITIQAKDDNTPEPRQTFILELTSATNNATLERNSKTADIMFMASDHPHGLFEFGTPQEITVSEDAMQVTVPVQREFGSLGQVRVGYTTTPGTAVSDRTLTPDFKRRTEFLVFADNQRRQTVAIDIVNDVRSEGPEYFFINLTTIELQQPLDNNYTVVSGLQLDLPPQIGPRNFKKVIIDKNDNAEGIVEFAPEAANFIAYEQNGIAMVPVIRGPGTFGDVRLRYTVSNGTALAGADFLLPSGELVLPSGVGRSTINVTVVDDGLREFAEQFEITLTPGGLEGGAFLGSRTTAVVTIAKSDYPNGRFSFIGQTEVTIPNPDVRRSLVFNIARDGGLIGRQRVNWRIVGPNDPNRVLEETNDVSTEGTGGRELTQGFLVWQPNEAGPKSFVLTIKPHAGWEIAKNFTIVISDIQGFPANTGSGEVNPTASNLTLKIQKFGDPNGIIRFDGIAQQGRVFEEPIAGKRIVRFPLFRRQGTIGDVSVTWKVQGRGTNNVTADVEQVTGTALIEGDKRTGEVTIFILADTQPELNEVFSLHLVSADGGAEIDGEFNVSSFTIRYNEFPHGRFGMDPAAQRIIVSPGNAERNIRLNITREDGAVGTVRVSYTVVYDQTELGISYVPSSGAVQFEDGSRSGVTLIDIDDSISLAQGSSFTATLTSASFIGVGVTMSPQLIAGRTVARIVVPPEAANSEVGFNNIILTVDEETNLVDVAIVRRGSYGSLQVDWVTGYPVSERPQGYAQGQMSEQSGTVSMVNGRNSTSFKIQLSPRQVPELFALHLPRTPISQTLGGATLWPGRTTVRLEPYGLVRFVAGSRSVSVQEPDQRQLEVTLQIERLYGSLDAIQIRYRTFDGTAIGGSDYDSIENGAVNMDALQIRSSIFIQIQADRVPEEDEYFYVNFTSVLRLPTGTEQDVSPRLSRLYSSAKVTISRNNDPYGVVSVVANSGESDGKVSEPGAVELSILRTGGTFGTISVQLRTIGGGESWDSIVGVAPSRTNETISEVLGNRDISFQALAGQDYQTLDRTVTFEEGQTQQTVRLFTLDDRNPEDDEVFFVYLVSRTEGVRVAEPGRDNGRKGFASITIRRNDFWNGWIGFHKANSTAVTADEDVGRPATLTIERLNASFGALTVYWEARISREDGQVKNDQLDLTAQLATVKDDVECPAGQRFCVFDVQLVNDQTPQNQTSFVIELSQVSLGAQIDPSRRFADVTLLPSDSPNGLVQFAASSRVMYIDKATRVARLEVERVGYRNKRVSVKVLAQELPGPGPDIIAGLRVYRALDGADFNSYFSELTFVPGQRSQSVDITLDPAKASDNPYPKLFRVTLTDVTNGAELGKARANVTIVNAGDVALWDVWPGTQRDLDNATIDGLMADLQAAIQGPITPSQLTITENIIDQIITTAESTPLLQGTRASIMSVFCRLLDPERADATRGRWQLSRLLERFAYSYLVAYMCDTCCTASALIYSPECPHVQFAVAKWYPEAINSYRYQGRNQDNYIVPENLLRVQDHGRNSANPKCMAVSFVEYSTSLWFLRGSETLLNNRVLSAGVRGEAPRLLSQPATYRIHTADRRVPAKRAQCVFFDEDIQQWTSRGDVCVVVNNLALAIDNFVDCQCQHMSSYAVISQVKNPDLIGYPVWFHISCFICMVGVVLAILAHHVCITQAMFSANLLMHMFFAIFATELLYVIDAYLSPGHLLDVAPTANNYRCIVMSIFLQYFFLAQFTWMMTQAINFWKILVLNDEHTERKYVLYFLLGWGIPGLTVFLFCVLTYVIYRYATDLPPDRFYGDVNNSEDICFIVNGYAALGGVVVPALVCLMVVGIVFIQAFQLSPQWQAYDDIYRSRYNIHEIRTMLGLWALVILTWLWGGLHMAYSQLWMLILFCIFNVAVGLYALVVYAVLRNPCLPCFRPQKATYAINYSASEADDFKYPPAVLPSVGVGSIKGSRASLVNDAWEHESISPVNNNLRVKRSQVNGSVYVVPSPPYVETKPPSHRAVEDHDSQDFDELIFALKTGGGFTPSEMSHPPNPNEIPDATEANYEMRRISIADTHL